MLIPRHRLYTRPAEAELIPSRTRDETRIRACAERVRLGRGTVLCGGVVVVVVCVGVLGGLLTVNGPQGRSDEGSTRKHATYLRYDESQRIRPAVKSRSLLN